MNADKVFLDTNVLVYSHDKGTPKKKSRALAVLGELAEGQPPTISTQVLQEFYVTVVRKLPVPLGEAEAEEAVLSLLALPIVQVDAVLVVAAIRASRRLQLSFWDALIVQAAIESGCGRLLTEDLQHGRLIDGVLRVENPFLES